MVFIDTFFHAYRISVARHRSWFMLCLVTNKILGSARTLLGITKADIHIALGDLASVICCDTVNIRFLHASLADFLLDKSRSKQYFVDKDGVGS